MERVGTSSSKHTLKSTNLNLESSILPIGASQRVEDLEGIPHQDENKEEDSHDSQTGLSFRVAGEGAGDDIDGENDQSKSPDKREGELEGRLIIIVDFLVRTADKRGLVILHGGSAEELSRSPRDGE